MHRSGIASTHIFLCFQQPWISHRLIRQRQHLEHPTIKGDQILSDQSVPRLKVRVRTDAQQGTDPVIAVIRKPVPVRHQDQKQVQQYLIDMKARKIPAP